MSLTYILPLRSDAYITLKICMDFWKETKDDKKIQRGVLCFRRVKHKAKILDEKQL